MHNPAQFQLKLQPYKVAYTQRSFYIVGNEKINWGKTGVTYECSDVQT